LRAKTAVTLICITLLISACSFKYTETQDIEITHYPDNERNAKLAEDLMYYDPQFLAHEIPALDQDTSKGIRIGYFVRSFDGKPSYRITYNRSIDAVEENIDELKTQFEAFIPLLAEKHASREALFLELEPIGLSWAKDFFAADAGTILQESSQVLRDYVTVLQLSKMQGELAKAYGPPTSVSYVRAQYYEAFDDVPESVSLFYEAEMADESSFVFRVSLHETDDGWRAIGFRFDKIR